MIRTVRSLAAVVVIALALAGCPGPERSDDQKPAGNCKGTYAGALSGSFTCEVNASVQDGKVVVDIAAFTVTGGAMDLVPATVEWTGALDAATYTEATAGITGYSAVFTESAVYYGTKSAGIPDTGSFSLVISSVEPQATGTGYDVHGTYQATLRRFPVVDGAADVTLSVSY